MVRNAKGHREVEGSPVRRNAKGCWCNLEWVSVWVGVIDDLEWDLECFICNGELKRCR